jgi:hypothetical protein
MKAWYDDIDCATLQRIKAYSAFNDATSKNLMIQTMYEYREKEIKDFKKTNHELAELCIQRKKHIKDLEKENAELKAQIEKMKCCGNCAKNGHICVAEEMQGKLCGKNKDKWELKR